MALVTLAALKKALGITDSSRDAVLSPIVDQVDYSINQYLGYDPETTSYTEFLDATGGQELVLLECPPTGAVTITGVFEDYDRLFGSDTELTANEGYVQKKNGSVGHGTLIRLGTLWGFDRRREINRLSAMVTPSYGTVKVTYTVDTTAVLAVATRAAMLEALSQVNAQGASGLGVTTSDSMDGASVSVNTNWRSGGGRPDTAGMAFVSPLVAPMLLPFRKIPMAR